MDGLLSMWIGRLMKEIQLSFQKCDTFRYIRVTLGQYSSYVSCTHTLSFNPGQQSVGAGPSSARTVQVPPTSTHIFDVQLPFQTSEVWLKMQIFNAKKEWGAAVVQHFVTGTRVTIAIIPEWSIHIICTAEFRCFGLSSYVIEPVCLYEILSVR